MQNYNFVKNNVFVAKICKYALYESSEGLFCAPRKAANFCHPALLNLGDYTAAAQQTHGHRMRNRTL